ncbi:hypothetical protein F2Q68_00043718 [Brassica cretica]|uniref:Uncharacterized protein n=2 Tax=Brassica cretica TaxID=69181 RepID=A0ABQ7AQN0_BRACR|nr:hypothetical protein F2Q68_00043718 [Brassica cretica]KAF3516462.1 hypothetical protein DY000_02059570 [Brassica cretica]
MTTKPTSPRTSQTQPQLYHTQTPTPSERSFITNHHRPSLISYIRTITSKESSWRPSHSSAETAGRKRLQI